jgi:hypothetical protein
MNRPEKDEYNEYYETYISLVPETEIVPLLENQIAEVQNLCAAIPEEKASLAYAEGKWTIKEVIGHLADAEKIFSYRAFRIARADQTPIEGFEQDGYIEHSRFNERTLADLTEEFFRLREANNYFFRNLNDEAWRRVGTANNNEISVRALAYITVGHVRHHLNVLKTRYLAQ